MKGCPCRQQQLILRTRYAHMETAKRKFTYTLRHAYITHTDLIRTHGNIALEHRTTVSTSSSMIEQLTVRSLQF